MIDLVIDLKKFREPTDPVDRPSTLPELIQRVIFYQSGRSYLNVPVYFVVLQKERPVDSSQKYFHFSEFDLIQYHSTFEFCPDSSCYPMQEFSNLDSSF